MTLQVRHLNQFFMIVFALLMLVGAHYFQHNQGGSGLMLAQNNVVWIFFSLLIALGFWKITIEKIFIYSRFTLLFCIACILLFIPLFYPNNVLADQSYTRLLGLIAGLLLFIGLQQMNFTRQQIKQLLFLIVVAGFLQSCYSLMQDYLLPKDNIFGYDVGYGRPYGIFQQPNVLASFMATTLILSGYLLQIVNNKKWHLFLAVNIVLNMWVITIAMSRTGYLGVIIALALFSPWAWKNNKKQLGLLLISILLGLGFASMKGDALAARNVESMKEGGARLGMYSHSWQMIKQKPLMGYGYGSFEKNYLISHAVPVKNKELPPEASILTHPHNDTLFWAIEGGVIPVLAILLLIVSFIVQLSHFNLSRALALLALVVPIALHTQTEYPLYHSSLHWLVLIVLVFYVDYERQKLIKKEFQFTFALRVFAILIPLVTTIFMITNLITISEVTKYERSKKPDIRLLLDVANPLVFQDRFVFHINYFRLQLAIKARDHAEIKSIIEDTKVAISTSPKPYFYVLLYHAYMSHAQKKEAEEQRDLARYLFPADKQIMQLGKAVSISNATKEGSVSMSASSAKQ